MLTVLFSLLSQGVSEVCPEEMVELSGLVVVELTSTNCILFYCFLFGKDVGFHLSSLCFCEEC